jgi:hypothetical protein
MRLRYIMGPTPAESALCNAETGEIVEGVEFVGLNSSPDEDNRHRLTIELVTFEFGIPTENAESDVSVVPQPSKN